MSTNARQLRLFNDVYAVCQNCGDGVDALFRVRRFRVCARCYDEIVPAFERAVTPEEISRIGEFWQWYEMMERRYPLARPVRVRRINTNYQDNVDIGEFWPFCRGCGAEVAEYGRAFSYRRSLFGGPRHAYCERCDARSKVRAWFDIGRRAHPDWDDEDFLDWMYEHNRRAFDLGILPDMWFELVMSSGA